VGVHRDCPNFLSTPIISGTDKATKFKFGRYIHRVHPILGENGTWAYPGTFQIFGVPLLSQELVKLRTSTFVRTFLVSIGTKVYYKFLEK